MISISPKRLVLAILFAFVLYAVFVFLSGAGVRILDRNFDFSVVGTMGDAFGPLNTLMAALAAIGAIAAYQSQAEELQRLKDDSEAERSASIRRDFESTFFQMVSLFRDAAGEIAVRDTYGQNERTGRDGVRQLFESHIRATGIDAEDSLSYQTHFARHADDLGHYLRLFYHIIRFLDESDVENKTLYARILRASLSNSETLLIALNCVYGAGVNKLKPLVEKYSLLHNLADADRLAWRLDEKFSAGAFGVSELSANGALVFGSGPIVAR